MLQVPEGVHVFSCVLPSVDLDIVLELDGNELETNETERPRRVLQEVQLWEEASQTKAGRLQEEVEKQNLCVEDICKVLWNCAQLVQFDSVLTDKDKEFQSLKARLETINNGV